MTFHLELNTEGSILKKRVQIYFQLPVELSSPSPPKVAPNSSDRLQYYQWSRLVPRILHSLTKNQNVNFFQNYACFSVKINTEISLTHTGL
jgi:hypothetical protein